MKKTISQVVSERILILDGAMGTMIQQYNLKEEDFHGERFAHIPGQLKGNNLWRPRRYESAIKWRDL